MADINDINSWIMRAKYLEDLEPLKARNILEAADRKLGELLYIFPSNPLYQKKDKEIKDEFERINNLYNPS